MQSKPAPITLDDVANYSCSTRMKELIKKGELLLAFVERGSNNSFHMCGYLDIYGACSDTPITTDVFDKFIELLPLTGWKYVSKRVYMCESDVNKLLDPQYDLMILRMVDLLRALIGWRKSAADENSKLTHDNRLLTSKNEELDNMKNKLIDDNKMLNADNKMLNAGNKRLEVSIESLKDELKKKSTEVDELKTTIRNLSNV